MYKIYARKYGTKTIIKSKNFKTKAAALKAIEKQKRQDKKYLKTIKVVDSDLPMKQRQKFFKAAKKETLTGFKVKKVCK